MGGILLTSFIDFYTVYFSSSYLLAQNYDEGLENMPMKTLRKNGSARN